MDSSPSKSLPIEAVSKVFWEPGVLTGYRRPNQPWMYYIKSLFWIHNESGNIWTHLVTLPILFGVIYKLTQLIDFGSNAAANSLLVFVVTTFTVALLSSAAHLFHSKSIPMHSIMLSVDYLGISIFSYGVSCMLYYCSGNELFYSYFGNIYPVMNWIAGINFTVCCTLGNSLYKGHHMKDILQQTSVLIAFVATQVPVICRVYSCLRVGAWLSNLKLYHVGSPLACLSSSVIFAVRLPETSWPGKFDNWGHSHQWFHLTHPIYFGLQLMACYHDLFSIPRKVLDLAQPNAMAMWWGLLIYFLVNVIIVLFILYKYRNVTRSDKHVK